MNKSFIENHLSELTSVIQDMLDSKKHVPALILIYSSIDILSWLNRPASNSDVTKSDFTSWVDKYLLPGSTLACSSPDLYAARCGIVHSYQSESRLSREGKAKKIWYAYGNADVNLLMTLAKKHDAVVLQEEELFKALKQGISNFLTSLDADPGHAKMIYERAEKFFSNIPHEQGN